MKLERLAKRFVSPFASPMTKRYIIEARDRAAGGVAVVRNRLDDDRIAPSLFIIGAQKAGTTFLHHQLELHPDVVSPLTKELHFFDDRYARGLGWYLGHFPRARTDRSIAIESSPGYLFHPRAVGRLAADIDDSRVVVLLRDPTARAYSHFLHERRLGFESEASFDRALELEEERIGPDLERIERDPNHVGYSWRHHSYFARGEYLPQIRRCHDLLGRDRVLVVRSEDMFDDPMSTLRTVHEFAGLTPWEADRLVPNDMSATGDPPMEEITARRLRERFAPSNRALADYLDTELSW